MVTCPKCKHRFTDKDIEKLANTIADKITTKTYHLTFIFEDGKLYGEDIQAKSLTAAKKTTFYKNIEAHSKWLVIKEAE